jgi:glyoxylase-like metal-dependent hydrolase (beta-lactamase superfamily II)
VTAPGETYEVVVVRYGQRSTTRGDVFLNYPVYKTPDGPIGMDYFFWVLRSDRRTVVVDTGFSPAGGGNRARTTLVDPIAAFAGLGVRPDDAPTVIVTHAHYDHIGNLAHFDRSPVVIARAETDFWSGPHAHRPLFHHSVEDAELKHLAAVLEEGRAVVFDDAHTVADGIEVLRVGGHTPGQSVVFVRTEAGPVLLASDAVHYYEELTDALPFMSVADLVAMYDGFDLINGLLAADHVVDVVSGHDPSTLARYPALAAAAGHPLTPGLAGNAAVVGRLR